MRVRENVKYIPIKSISNVSHYGKVSQTFPRRAFPSPFPREHVYLKQYVIFVGMNKLVDRNFFEIIVNISIEYSSNEISCFFCMVIFPLKKKLKCQ